MSSRVDRFECHWRPSRRLWLAYGLLAPLALIAPWLSELPGFVCLAFNFCCTLHAAWCLPRQVLLSSPRAWRGVRHDEHGWQLWSACEGWQSVQLLPDSLVLSWLVVMRIRRPGRRFSESLCVPADALSAQWHRRLRVRLRFSRARWAAPE